MSTATEAEFTLAYRTFRDLLEQGKGATWRALAKAQTDVLLSMGEGDRALVIDLITSTMIAAAVPQEEGRRMCHDG